MQPEVGTHRLQLLDVSDVAAELRCSKGFVYQLIRSGELSGLKLGRLTRVTRVSLDDFVRMRLAEATAERERWTPRWDALVAARGRRG